MKKKLISEVNETPVNIRKDSSQALQLWWVLLWAT